MPARRFHHISFKHAFDGIVHTYANQPNLRIHLGISLLVLIASYVLKLERWEWAVIIFTIMWVIISEMVNTALEAVVDLLVSEYHISAKIAKDVAAGMVLIGAMGSVAIGLLIFIPHLWVLIP